MKQLFAILVAATFAAMSYTAVAQDKMDKADKSQKMDKKSDKKPAKKASKKASKKSEADKK
jgi:Ni/Co efflux regulator RcnB